MKVSVCVDVELHRDRVIYNSYIVDSDSHVCASVLRPGGRTAVDLVKLQYNP